MPSFSALTTLDGKEAAERLGELLEELDPAPYGVGVFEIEDGSNTWEVGAYFLESPDAVALDLLGATQGARPFAVSEVPDKDWVAEVRRELSPVIAGRFFVYGAHDADKLPSEALGLKIEAAMAFGTGHHGTTQGCLTALDQLAVGGFQPKDVFDVGCGTAVLAMGAAKLWDCSILASDIDEVAVATSIANLKSNDLEGRIDVVEAAGFDHPAISNAAPFDLVLANILKGPLVEMSPVIARNMVTGGYVILSGILNEQAEEVIAAFADQGFDLKDHLKIGEWTTLVMQQTA